MPKEGSITAGVKFLRAAGGKGGGGGAVQRSSGVKSKGGLSRQGHAYVRVCMHRVMPVVMRRLHKPTLARRRGRAGLGAHLPLSFLRCCLISTNPGCISNTPPSTLSAADCPAASLPCISSASPAAGWTGARARQTRGRRGLTRRGLGVGQRRVSAGHTDVAAHTRSSPPKRRRSPLHPSCTACPAPGHRERAA